MQYLNLTGLLTKVDFFPTYCSRKMNCWKKTLYAHVHKKMHNLHIHAYEEVLPREVEGLLILEKTIKIILGGKFRLKATVAQDIWSLSFSRIDPTDLWLKI